MSKTLEDSPEKSKLKQLKTNKPPLNITKNQNLRIIQKKLVYVIGLSSSIANKDVKFKSKYQAFNKTRIFRPIRSNHKISREQKQSI